MWIPPAAEHREYAPQLSCQLILMVSHLNHGAQALLGPPWEGKSLPLNPYFGFLPTLGPLCSSGLVQWAFEGLTALWCAWEQLERGIIIPVSPTTTTATTTMVSLPHLWGEAEQLVHLTQHLTPQCLNTFHHEHGSGFSPLSLVPHYLPVNPQLIGKTFGWCQFTLYVALPISPRTSVC